MITYYRFFEDIGGPKKWAFKTCDEMAQYWKPDNHTHQGWACQFMGEVKGSMPPTYCLIEILSEGRQTKRRGYFTVKGRKDAVTLPAWEPTTAHRYRLIIREIDEALTSLDLLTRIHEQMPDDTLPDIKKLFEQCDLQRRHLFDNLTRLKKACGTLLPWKDDRYGNISRKTESGMGGV